MARRVFSDGLGCKVEAGKVAIQEVSAMKKRKKPDVVRSALESTEALGLTKEDAVAMELRARQNIRIGKSAKSRREAG